MTKKNLPPFFYFAQRRPRNQNLQQIRRRDLPAFLIVFGQIFVYSCFQGWHVSPTG